MRSAARASYKSSSSSLRTGLAVLCFIILAALFLRGGDNAVERALLLSSPPPEPLTMTLHVHTYGDIVFRFIYEAAPRTVTSYVTLGRLGHYTNATFYRYEGWCLQGGTWPDINGQFRENPSKVGIPQEYNSSFPNKLWAVSVARGEVGHPLTEFSIMTEDNSQILPGYAVFAEIADGFDTIAKIRKLPAVGGKIQDPKPWITHATVRGALPGETLSAR